MVKIFDSNVLFIIFFIPFMAFVMFGICEPDEIPIHIYILAAFIFFACIFVLFTKYSFNEEYLEQSIFGKKRQLLLKDIDCIRTTVFWGSLIVMCKNSKYPKGGYSWMINFTFQKKKRQLFFEYIKKVNPKCRLCF